jgi:hypothetical protein
MEVVLKGAIVPALLVALIRMSDWYWCLPKEERDIGDEGS